MPGTSNRSKTAVAPQLARGGAQGEKPRVPDHELIRCIGSGSYGEVWLARNVMGAWRAVKVVHRDRFQDDRPYEREFGGIQKFEPISRSHESQVDILHVGRNDAAGYFYYVMELADDASQATGGPGADGASGRALEPETYAPKTLRSELQRGKRLPFEDCVEISLALCTALGHLHRHGLVHRDVKPANIIFVNGIPKLADIGLVTESAQAQTFVGTEGYLPPEGPGTAQGDLYSFGKVLYEMATGRDRLEFPQLPTLIGEEKGREELLELNEIILKACEADPAKRYQEATQVHADLLLLRIGKSVKHTRGLERRLRWLVRAGAVVLAGGGLATGAFFYQRDQARRAWEISERESALRHQAQSERQRADEQAAISTAVNAFLQEDLLRQADSSQQADRGYQQDPELTVKEALQRASERIGKRFADQPLVEAEIRQTLGNALTGVGEAAKGIPHLERAVTLHQAQTGAEHPRTLRSMSYLAAAYRLAGRLAEAIELNAETLRIRSASLGPSDRDTIVSMNNLALTYQQVGRLSESIPLHEESLRLRKARFGPEHPSTITSMHNLAIAYSEAGRLSESIPLYEETMRLRKAKLGPEHPDTLTSMNSLALAYLEAGRLSESIPLHEEALKLRKAKLGPEHPATLTSMNTLAGAYSAANRLTEAISLYEETMRLRKAKLGPEHPSTLTSMSSLALAYTAANRLTEAIPLYEETVRLRKAKLGPKHPDTLTSMSSLASAYAAANRLTEAIPLSEETLALRKEELGPEHPDTLRSMNNLAIAYRKAKRLSNALPLYEETLRLRKSKLGPDHPATLTSMNNLAFAYREAGRLTEAIPLHEETLRLQKAKLGPEHPSALNSMNNLADAYTAANKLSEAESLLREHLPALKERLPDHWRRFLSEAMLGGVLLRQNRGVEAESFLLSGYEGLKQRKESIPANYRSWIRTTARRLAELYEALGKPDQAADWKAKVD